MEQSRSSGAMNGMSESDFEALIFPSFKIFRHHLIDSCNRTVMSADGCVVVHFLKCNNPSVLTDPFNRPVTKSKPIFFCFGEPISNPRFFFQLKASADVGIHASSAKGAKGPRKGHSNHDSPVPSSASA